jgi:signal transduction histidine kinase
MEEKNNDRYEILKRLALAGSRGEGLRETVEMALRQAADLVGLTAAAMYLWDDEMVVNLAVSHAETDASRERLESLEADLFRTLRKDQQLLSAYMTFGGETPLHSFTLPLQQGKRIFGAVMGLQEGNRTVINEDTFLEALSAAIALNVVAGGLGKDTGIDRDALDKERLGAVVETAVTVNHEINNPLTAILGNVQLLLLKRDDLDEELLKKLQTIEASAMRIRDVTQQLLKLTSARSVSYAEGTSMLDLSAEDEEESSK